MGYLINIEKCAMELKEHKNNMSASDTLIASWEESLIFEINSTMELLNRDFENKKIDKNDLSYYLKIIDLTIDEFNLNKFKNKNQ